MGVIGIYSTFICRINSRGSSSRPEICVERYSRLHCRRVSLAPFILLPLFDHLALVDEEVSWINVLPAPSSATSTRSASPATATSISPPTMVASARHTATPTSLRLLLLLLVFDDVHDFVWDAQVLDLQTR
jgi:hypothetical protein